MNRRRFLRAGLVTLATVTGLATASIRLPEERKLRYEPSTKTIVFDEYDDLKAGWWPPLPLTLPPGKPIFYQMRNLSFETPKAKFGPSVVAAQVFEQRRWRAVPLRDGRRPNYHGFRWVLD